MINSERKEYYELQIYNSDSYSPITTSKVDDFLLEQLSSPVMKDFNLIIIAKCTKFMNNTFVNPQIIIYDRYEWNVGPMSVEDIYGDNKTVTCCFNDKKNLYFNGELKLFPCNNQEEMIEKYNTLSDSLTKGKILRRILTKLKK